MKRIILIFFHYCEDEVYIYESLDKLLKDWNYSTLKSFIDTHKDCCIYELGKTIYEAE